MTRPARFLMLTNPVRLIKRFPLLTLSPRIVLLILVVATVHVFFGLQIDVIDFKRNSLRSVQIDEDKSCRTAFNEEYNRWCSISLRPLPSNYFSHLDYQRRNDGESSPVVTALCPCTANNTDSLRPRAVDYNTTLSWTQLLSRHSVSPSRDKASLTTAGRWRPMWCVPRHRIAVLVPIRYRENHLSILLNVLHPFLRLQLLDYTIIVIEQTDPPIFNRAALLNAGYLEAKSRAATSGGEYDCFIFHDVDLYPQDVFNYYVCSSIPRHMAAYRQGWNYELLYPLFFGGVTALHGEHFEILNGFPNSYYGWGGEDDELWYRARAKKMKLADRYPKCVSKYSEVKHERDAGNPTFFNKHLGILYRPNEYDKDGLNTVNYTVLSYQEKSLYTRITVRLPPGPPLELYVGTASLCRCELGVVIFLMLTHLIW